MGVRYVGIGVNHYPVQAELSGGSEWELDYASHDAVVLGDTLENSGLLASRQYLADDYVGLRPTRGEIWRLVRRMPKTEEPLLVYFAGHGTCEGGELRVCPSDFDAGIADKSSIPVSELIRELYPKASWLMVILDCCRAPLVTSNRDDTFELEGTIRVADNVIVALGCSNGEQSLEAPAIGDGYGGIFSYFLARSFSRTFRNRKVKRASVAQIFEAARDDTASFAREEADVSQVPRILGAHGGDYYFIREDG